MRPKLTSDALLAASPLICPGKLVLLAVLFFPGDPQTWGWAFALGMIAAVAVSFMAPIRAAWGRILRWQGERPSVPRGKPMHVASERIGR